MIFGIDAVVLAHHYIYIEVCVDHLFRGVCIVGVRQDHITVATEKVSCLLIITDVNSEPGIAPEIAHLVFFRNPGIRSPAHFRTCRGPDDKVLVTGWYMVAVPAGPLAAIYQHFPYVCRK